MNRLTFLISSLFLTGLLSISAAHAQDPTPNADKKEQVEKVKSGGAVKIEKKPAVPAAALKQADKEEAQTPPVVKEETKQEDRAAEKSSSGSHLFGLHAALGFPHPLSAGLNYVHSSHLFSAELSAGNYSGTFSDVKVGMQNTELALRWHPWAGSFFLGAIVGSQKITAEKSQYVAQAATTVNGKVEVKSNYITPHFGWLWGGTGGFFASMEFGYQSPSSVKTDFSTDANALAQTTPDYMQLEKDVRKQGDDIGNMGLPHVVLLKVGWLF